MGVFDFFKNFLASKEPVVAEEHITFPQIPSWLKKKEQDISDEESTLFFSLKDKMKDLAVQLDEQLLALEHVDLSQKKVEDKIKVVVRGNARTYAQHVSRLKEHMERHDATELAELRADLNKKMLEFDKKTRMNYQKATYLIGKEMADIQKSIGEFYHHLNKQLEQNRHVVDAVAVIASVKVLLAHLEDTNNVLSEIDAEIKSLEKKKKSLLDKVKKKEQEIASLKNSEAYVSNEQKKKDIETKKRDISLNMQSLKSMIDFKKLGNVFHSSPRKMQEIKGLKSSFASGFEKDDGVSLLKMLSEAHLDSDDVKAAIKNVNMCRKDLASLQASLSEDPTSGLVNELDSLTQEISLVEDDKGKELKRRYKEELRKEELRKEIVAELAKVHVIVD